MAAARPAAVETSRHNAVDQICAARLRLHEAIRFVVAAGEPDVRTAIEHVIDDLRTISMSLEQGGGLMLLDVDAGVADAIEQSGRSADELVREALDKAGAR